MKNWKHVVKGDNKKITPTENTVKIGISSEEEQSPVTLWNGNARRVVSEWKIVSVTYGDSDVLQVSIIGS